MLRKLFDFFKRKIQKAERDDLDPYTGLPKHLVEKQELAYIEVKLMREGKEKELEELERQLGRGQKKKEKKPFSNICFSCGFPYAAPAAGAAAFTVLDFEDNEDSSSSESRIYSGDDDWDSSRNLEYYDQGSDDDWNSLNIWDDNSWINDNDWYWDSSSDDWNSSSDDWDSSFDSGDSMWDISDEISLGAAGIPPYDDIYGFSDNN